jgi:hypothetical protein
LGRREHRTDRPGRLNLEADMNTRIFILVATLSLAATLPVSAQPLPASGELDKTDWSMTKDDVAASLSARVKATAVITAEKISYSTTDFTQGLMNDGAQYLFTNAGAFQEAAFLRTFNLEKEKTAQFFKDFVTVTLEQYVKKLGEPDVDTTKTVGPNDAPLTVGVVAWAATAKKPYRLEIRIMASGTLVFYTESCTHGAAK